MKEPDVIGNDIGKGEIGGHGNDPAEGLGAFIESLGAEIREGGESALDGGKDGGVFDERLHEGIAFGEMGVLEAFFGRNKVSDVENDHGKERRFEHGVAETGKAEIRLDQGLGLRDGDGAGIEVDTGVVGLGGSEAKRRKAQQIRGKESGFAEDGGRGGSRG